MRDKLIIVLLSVCCTLLVVNLIALWNDTTVVHGQAAGGGGASGDYTIATSATQNEPVCFIFKSDGHLAAYMARSSGIRVMGVRDTQYDFNYAEVNKHFSVLQAKKQSPK